MRAAGATDDLNLADRCVSGDEAAQGELFRRERHRVHATLYRILGSNFDIDDLIQQTFIEIYRSLGSFRGEAKLSTWIDRIATRVAFAHIARRRPQRVSLTLLSDLPSGQPSAEDRAMMREAARRVYAILDRIDPRQRVAFTLCVLDGRPFAEVARIMEASVVLTKVRAWRATQAVKKSARKDPLLATFLRADEAQEETG
jgi:RNA polymerase sigma-70 factor (ECF subfamily)